MSNFEVSNFNDKSSDNVTKGGQLSESIHRELTTEDFKKHLINKVKPDVCIRDQDGFIACGPIVGYERPEPPIFKPRFDNPIDIEKFPRNLIDKVSPRDQPNRINNLDAIEPYKSK
ncbi:MAG: hypothetical protein WC028_12870 [Candidatus Obscuribacterales bacterium]